MAFTDGPQVPRHFIQTKYIYYKPKNSHRPLCSHLRPRCSHLHAEGRNEARCLADGVRGHSHSLGLDCYSAASSDHTLAACGAVGAAVASGVRSEYTQSAPPFVRSHSHHWREGAPACASETVPCTCCPGRLFHVAFVALRGPGALLSLKLV